MFERPRSPLASLACALLLALPACSDDSQTAPKPEAGVPDGPRADGPQTSKPVTYNAAGSIGELLRYELDIVGLSYDYEIVDSAFGLKGKKATGTLIKNADGSYSPSSDPDASLIVLPNGLVVGSEELEVAGKPTVMLFAGTPAVAAAYTPAEIAGVYNFIEFTCDKSVDPSCGPGAYFTSYGTVKVEAGGSFEVCGRGAIDDQQAHPCEGGGTLGGSWSDNGDGVIALKLAGADFGSCMLLPSASGGKVMVIDQSGSGALPPGLIVGVKKVSVGGEDLSGTYRFTGHDGNGGEVSVDSAANSYSGTITEPGQGAISYKGTLQRDTPWSGWLKAKDDSTGEETQLLILPGDGVFFNSAFGSGKNDWIDIGGKL